MTTKELEDRWVSAVEEISGMAWSIRWEALRGNGDDYGSNLDLMHSRLLLQDSDAMTANTELTKRLKEEGE